MMAFCGLRGAEPDELSVELVVLVAGSRPGALD
jgi:hypothetical protein